MDGYLRSDGEVKMLMIMYINKITEGFPEEMGTSKAATMADKNLFQVRNPDEERLVPEE